MKKAQYICFEGTEGVGKTTQTQKLVDYLRSKGYKVLHTKEPGTPLEPLTMLLRGIMLDNKYDAVLTMPAREFISQAIRSIHLERVIVPAMSEYDFIIQDRGIMSGYSYGHACGNDLFLLESLAKYNLRSGECRESLPHSPSSLYDKVVYLTGNTSKGLEKALSSKQEFETGDAMESRGLNFLEQVSSTMEEYTGYFNTVKVSVDNKDIDTVFDEIITKLNLKDE